MFYSHPSQLTDLPTQQPCPQEVLKFDADFFSLVDINSSHPLLSDWFLEAAIQNNISLQQPQRSMSMLSLGTSALESQDTKETVRSCYNCGVKDTKYWRSHPLFASQSLCNPCGLYWKLRGRDRPTTLYYRNLPRKSRFATIQDAEDGVRKCSSCGIEKTPTWRRDSATKKILCNACGLRNRPRLRRAYSLPNTSTQ